MIIINYQPFTMTSTMYVVQDKEVKYSNSNIPSSIDAISREAVTCADLYNMNDISIHAEGAFAQEIFDAIKRVDPVRQYNLISR